MTPRERLAAALADVLERGVRLPCSGSDRWTHDDNATRAKAAHECQGCPIFTACDAAGAAERWHVWGGRERGRTSNPAGRPKRGAA